MVNINVIAISITTLEIKEGIEIDSDDTEVSEDGAYACSVTKIIHCSLSFDKKRK